MKKPTKILLILLAVAVVLNVSYFIDDIYDAVARSVVFKPGVVLKNNVTITAGTIDKRNGSATSPATDWEFWTREKGGVDDYNDGGSIPGDTFTENFTQCDSGNNYCSTNDSIACAGGTHTTCHQDNQTNLVWSDWLDEGDPDHTWFWANNCYEPETGENPGTCVSNDDDACQCVKKTSSLVGCEALGDGKWRLPHQKELMQVYINGSWGTLSHAGYAYWSATTQSNNTTNAWRTGLTNGNTGNNNKTNTFDSRCVR